MHSLPRITGRGNQSTIPHVRYRIVLASLLLAAPAFAGVSFELPPLPADMKRVESRSYLLIHDLTDAEAAEAVVRMDAMADEYARRTRDFAGRVQGKMPFILFRHENDYLAAGAPEGSGGVFNGKVLMAIAGKRLTNRTWATIQHEGFHQYAFQTMSRDLPAWLNEGLAEYFGEGVYCGDTFVTGGIPSFRVKSMREHFAGKEFMPIDDMLALPYEQWNGNLKGENYDQAWSMVHFLAHADGGRYQPLFNEFIRKLSQRRPWKMAWNETFGTTSGFEQQWQTWWQTQPDIPTPAVYAEAAARIMAGFAARAASQRQAFASVDDLLAAIKKREVKSAPGDAWPVSLNDDCVALTAGLAKADIVFAMEFPKKGQTQWPLAVTATLKDGRVIRATTQTRGPRAVPVTVTTKAPPTTRKAKAK